MIEQVGFYLAGLATVPLAALFTHAARRVVYEAEKLLSRKRAIVTMRCWGCDQGFEDFSVSACKRMIRNHRARGCPGGADDE